MSYIVPTAEVLAGVVRGTTSKEEFWNEVGSHAVLLDDATVMLAASLSSGPGIRDLLAEFRSLKKMAWCPNAPGDLSLLSCELLDKAAYPLSLLFAHSTCLAAALSSEMPSCLASQREASSDSGLCGKIRTQFVR